MTWSRKELLEKIQEVEKDRRAFADASSRIHERINEIEGTPHAEFLHEWAGTQAALNVLIMVITRCEGVIEDMKANLDKLPEDRPSLKLVEGKDDEREPR
jgi:hypothetical protein